MIVMFQHPANRVVGSGAHYMNFSRGANMGDEKLLLKAISDVKPIRDNAKSASWLKKHRPSVAWLCCILSGPWKIERRTKVQAKAIEVLGDRDLTQLLAYEVDLIAPLDWQRNYIKAAIAYAKHYLNQTRFDTTQATCNKQVAKLIDIVRINELAHDEFCYGIDFKNAHKYVDACPKVVLMYIRDYINYDCFPIDRHVRKWLKGRGLPTRSDKLMPLFVAARKQARGYSRAIFGAQSKNPTHAPTA
jgi:hypothetical protein